MEKREEVHNRISNLKHGDVCYFNMFQDGGAVCYRIKGVYVLFEIPQYGGEEGYSGTYGTKDIDSMLDEAFSWT